MLTLALLRCCRRWATTEFVDCERSGGALLLLPGKLNDCRVAALYIVCVSVAEATRRREAECDGNCNSISEERLSSARLLYFSGDNDLWKQGAGEEGKVTRVALVVVVDDMSMARERESKKERGEQERNTTTTTTSSHEWMGNTGSHLFLSFWSDPCVTVNTRTHILLILLHHSQTIAWPWVSWPFSPFSSCYLRRPCLMLHPYLDLARMLSASSCSYSWHGIGSARFRLLQVAPRLHRHLYSRRRHLRQLHPHPCVSLHEVNC